VAARAAIQTGDRANRPVPGQKRPRVALAASGSDVTQLAAQGASPSPVRRARYALVLFLLGLLVIIGSVLAWWLGPGPVRAVTTTTWASSGGNTAPPTIVSTADSLFSLPALGFALGGLFCLPFVFWALPPEFSLEALGWKRSSRVTRE
jgi:hypothetical protein